MEVDVKEAEIKKVTRSAFYELLLIDEKHKLLKRMDSAYTAFLRVATLRLKAGETNMLEKASAENQLSQLKIQEKNLIHEKELRLRELMLLMNTDEKPVPISDKVKLDLPRADSATLASHPYLNWQRQQERVAAASIKMESAKLLPDISMAYNNMSLQDGISYNRGNRFQSVQLGVEIPVFAGAQRARIKSARTQQLIAKNDTHYRSKQLHTEFESILMQVGQYADVVEEYEKTALKNAVAVTLTLDKQLKNGEINYLEWTILNQQSLQVQLDYFDAVKNLNNSIINLNYLLSK